MGPALTLFEAAGDLVPGRLQVRSAPVADHVPEVPSHVLPQQLELGGLHLLAPWDSTIWRGESMSYDENMCSVRQHDSHICSHPNTIPVFYFLSFSFPHPLERAPL